MFWEAPERKKGFQMFLQDVHSFAPLQSQQFSKFSSNFWWCFFLAQISQNWDFLSFSSNSSFFEPILMKVSRNNFTKFRKNISSFNFETVLFYTSTSFDTSEVSCISKTIYTSVILHASTQSGFLTFCPVRRSTCRLGCLPNQAKFYNVQYPVEYFPGL